MYKLNGLFAGMLIVGGAPPRESAVIKEYEGKVCGAADGAAVFKCGITIKF